MEPENTVHCNGTDLDFLPEQLVSVVESSEVLELSQQLNRRLSAIRLEFWHVQIIYKDYYSLPFGRTCQNQSFESNFK